MTVSNAGNHNHNKNYTTNKIALEGVATGNPAYDSAGATKIAGFKDRLIVSGHSLTTSSSGSHTHTYTAEGTVDSKFSGEKTTTSSTGNNKPFNVMNPYIVTYIWKRIE